MKPTLIMAQDVNVVDTTTTTTTTTAGHHDDDDEASTAADADAVSAEILKTVAVQRVENKLDKEWSTDTKNPCSSPLKCYSGAKSVSSFADDARQQRTDKNFNTTSFNMMSPKSNNEDSFNESPRKLDPSVTDSFNGSVTSASSDKSYSPKVNGASVSAVPSKVAAPKKITPKLMRTPTSVVTRKRSSSSGPTGDGKRLDEELEELDAHLMSTTLKNVKYMPGPKFTIFNDVAFQRECLESHNKVRQKYGCPPLSWCQELADQAETWAQAVADRGRILYKELPGIGENISLLNANGSNHLPTGSEVTDLWADEVQHYNYARPAWSEKCQHFTQLIWKRTTEFGVGRVWVPSKSVVAIVAFYAPSGNCNGINEFRDNVPKPIEDGQFPWLLRKK